MKQKVGSTRKSTAGSRRLEGDETMAVLLKPRSWNQLIGDWPHGEEAPPPPPARRGAGTHWHSLLPGRTLRPSGATVGVPGEAARMTLRVSRPDKRRKPREAVAVSTPPDQRYGWKIQKENKAQIMAKNTQQSIFTCISKCTASVAPSIPCNLLSALLSSLHPRLGAMAPRTL
jgi:hypothetical protein